MRKLQLGFGILAIWLALPTAAHAQVSLSIGISFPEPPPLVVVSPGVQIVPEYDEEVYFTSGYYWVRRDDAWYRTRDCRGDWRPVRTVYVPATLVRIPPGRFRHYYRDDDGMWRPHHDDDWRTWRDRHPSEERRVWWRDHHRDRQVRMEQERAWREHEKAWREQDRDRREVERKMDRDRRREPQPARFDGRRDDRRGPSAPGPDRRRDDDHDRRDDDHDRGRGHDRDRH